MTILTLVSADEGSSSRNRTRRWIFESPSSPSSPSLTQTLLHDRRSHDLRQSAQDHLHLSGHRSQLNQRRPARPVRPPPDRSPFRIAHFQSSDSVRESVTAKIGDEDRSPTSSATTRSALLALRKSTSSQVCRQALDRVEVPDPVPELVLGCHPGNRFPTDQHHRQRHRDRLWTAPYDPVKSVHVCDWDGAIRRQRLCDNITRCPAPELGPPLQHRSVHQLALLHGVHEREMLFDPNLSIGDERHGDRARISEIERADLLPMYSSFTSDGIYREPIRILRNKRRGRKEGAKGPAENLFLKRREKGRPATAAIIAHQSCDDDIHNRTGHNGSGRSRSISGPNALQRCTTATTVRSAGFNK